MYLYAFLNCTHLAFLLIISMISTIFMLTNLFYRQLKRILSSYILEQSFCYIFPLMQMNYITSIILDVYYGTGSLSRTENTTEMKINFRVKMLQDVPTLPIFQVPQLNHDQLCSRRTKDNCKSVVHLLGEDSLLPMLFDMKTDVPLSLL